MSPIRRRIRIRRATWRLLVELGLMLLLLLLAARLRTNWNDLSITPDWPFFYQFDNELERSLGSGARAGFPLYTSIPFLLFSLVTRLFDDPVRALRAFAVLGSLAAPVTYLAARSLAGRAAGLAAGVMVAISAADCRNLTGLETPGPISLFAACAALGVVAGARRRPWGPPLMIFGTAMAVGHHTGLWLMAPLACGLAVLHGLRLPRRGMIQAGVGAVVVGGIVVGGVLLLDLARLSSELSQVDGIAGTWGHRTLNPAEHSALAQASGGYPRALFDLLFAKDNILGVHGRFGLNLTPVAAWLLVLTWVAGCSPFAMRAVRHLRRPETPAPRRGWTRWVAGAADVQLIALIGAGLIPYLWMMKEHLYLLPSHTVAFLPLMAVATVGTARTAARISRPSVRRVLPALVVAAWVGLVEFAPDRGGWDRTDSVMTMVWSSGGSAPPWSGAVPLERSSRSLRSAAVVSTAIREDARSRDVRPSVFGWFDWTDPHGVAGFTALVQEMANSSWRTHDLPPACYLIVSDADTARVAGGRRISTVPEMPFDVVGFETCAELSSLEAPLCGDRVRRVVHLEGNWPDDTDDLLGCATHGLW